MREPEILVVGEHFDRGEIRCTQVVDEPCDVAIPIGVDTESVTVLKSHSNDNYQEVFKRYQEDIVSKLTLLSRSNK